MIDLNDMTPEQEDRYYKKLQWLQINNYKPSDVMKNEEGLEYVYARVRIYLDEVIDN